MKKLIAAASLLALAACSNDVKGPVTGLSRITSPVAPSLSESSPRSGALHVTKECSQYTGLAGSFCTITSSNLNAIKVGSKVVYASGVVGGMLNSDLVIDGPGNNTAFGHVTLNLATGLGEITFAGGTGEFTWFNASIAVVVNFTTGVTYWDGTYSFSPRD